MAEGSLGFRVLGPLDVRRDASSVAPSGVRRRSLLAMLLLDVGRVVPVERLIDGIWGYQPPSSAIGLVQTYVSLWRRVLGEGASPDEPERLVREGHGYRLIVRPHELDAPGHPCPVEPSRRVPQVSLVHVPVPFAVSTASSPEDLSWPTTAPLSPSGR